MPNGGSDCCGTCWFNETNEGEAYYSPRTDNRIPDFCTIRELPVREPFYTYCANHPYRNPEGIEVPIGPVWEGTPREILKLSPDTEEARLTLLELVRQIQEEFEYEYSNANTLYMTLPVRA